MDTIDSQEQIAARTRIGACRNSGQQSSSRGRGSAPRSVGHVEVLGTDQWLALLILGDLDSYTPFTTP